MLGTVRPRLLSGGLSDYAKTMGRGTEMYEEAYSDDPFDRETKDKNRFAPLLLVLALVLSGFALRTVYAANISINSGSNLEFGQGFVTTAACSGNNNIVIAPQNTFDNTADGGSFFLSSVRVTGIPAGCSGKKLSFSAYNSTGSSPLTMFGTTESVLEVTPTGSTFVTGNSGVSLSNLSSSAFTATFSSPVAPAANVSRITVQSSADDDYANKGSISFDGSSLLSMSGVSAFGTGAFTAEFFVRLTSDVGGDGLFFKGSNSPGLYINSTRNQIKMQNWPSGAGMQIFYVSSLNLNTWYHIALVRDTLGRTQLFLNGTKSINSHVIDSNNYTGAIDEIFPAGTGHRLVGQLSNFRLTNNAVYDPLATTIPQPTAPLKNISGTLVLLKTSTDNPFADSSTSPKTVTRSGTPTSSSTSPFN